MTSARIETRLRQPASDPYRVVALGDSVTQGIGGVDEVYVDDVYHAVLKRRLQEYFSSRQFAVLNAGVDGNTAADGLARLSRDVIAHQPDLAIIGFGLNDAALGGEAGLTPFEQTLSAIVERLRIETNCDVVLLTPNMMLTRSNGAIPPRWRHVTDDFLAIQNGGQLARYAYAVRRVGMTAAIPVADVYAAWQQQAAAGVDTTAWLANGLNHPGPAGHRLISDLIFEKLFAVDADNLV